MSRRQAEPLFVAALARGATVRDAAAEAGMAERTAYRRMADPDIKRAVATARDQLLHDALSDLTAGAAEASLTLRDLLRSDSESIRLGACRAILSAVLNMREQAELADRLARIEADLAEQKA